jgi:hypothetical protein
MFKRLMAGAMLIALATSFSIPVWSADGAKGLFYEQLDKPSEQMNTGVQYWIELHRGSRIVRVNNKMAFRSGDKIRFHVKSNVDAYAYILLKEGSGGEQAVLFPDQAHNDEVKVTHGKEYSLPGDGFLTFDENPGTERLLLLLSRQPVDATAYLNNTANDRAEIAALPDGSKDLIPAKIVLAYEPAKEAFNQKTENGNTTTTTPPQAAAPQVSTASPSKPTPTNDATKPATLVSNAGSSHKPNKSHQTAKETKHAATSKIATKPQLQPGNNASNQTSDASGAIPEGGIVTVVHRDPGAVLALDLSLAHER